MPTSSHLTPPGLDRLMLDKVLIKRKSEQLKATRIQLIADCVEADTSAYSSTTQKESQFLSHIEACLNAGVSMIQLRSTSSRNSRRFLKLAKAIRTLCWEKDALLIIAGRADIAKACQADGIHLGPDDLEASAIRNLLGQECIIGASAYTQHDVETLIHEGVDYLTVGPMFSSDVLPTNQPIVGKNLVEWMLTSKSIPTQTTWFAAGGIHAGNLETVLDLGVKRVALTRGLMASATPGETAVELLAQLR